MNEDKAARYNRLRRRAAIVSTLGGLLLLVLLVACGVSIAMRDTAASLVERAGFPSRLRPWMVVTAYVVLLGVVLELMSLPLAWYRGYKLERRYGLSTETAGRWAVDHVKAIGVGLVFGVLGANLVYGGLRAFPRVWWVVAGTGFAATTILLTNVAPVLVLPLFYRVRPLMRDTLRQRLVALAARAGTRVLGVYEWSLGEKTRRANAALVGLGRTRRILLSDMLLAEYSDEEIEVILAHELAHHVHRDMWKALGYEGALIFAGFFVADRLLRALVPVAGLADPADVAGLPIVLLAAGALSLALVPLANALSRRVERRADRFALALTDRPAAFVSAVRRLSAQNLAEEQPSRLVEVLFHTHPPITQRIAAARAHGSGRPQAR